MIKRLITALLGASLAVAMSAGAASAADSAAEKLAAARDKATAAVDHGGAFSGTQAKAQIRAQDPTESGGEGEGGGGAEEPACVDPFSDEGKAIVDELSTKAFEATDALFNEDPVLLALDAKLRGGDDFLGGARGKYLAALEAATTPAQVEAAYKAYVAAIRAWNAGFKARLDQLKPEFAKIGEAYLAGLAKANICPEFIEAERKDLDNGQSFVTFYKQITDFLTEGVHEEGLNIYGYLEDARDLRDQRLGELESVLPSPDDTITPPGGGGPTLPDTGASAIPMLLGGLFLISGGSTALLIARRRRTAA